MSQEQRIERFFETLITGNREASRNVVKDAIREGTSPHALVCDLFWPTYQLIERLHQQHQITVLAHRLSTRLLRVLVDQTAGVIEPAGTRERSVFACCGPLDADELGAQMAVDLLEAAGFSVTFAGGGVAADEIMGRVQLQTPEVLLMFGSGPSDLPHIRHIIDNITEIGACPDLQIAVGGGVFNRAEGLAEEIGADLWAEDPMELVDLLINEPERRAGADQRTVGRNRRRRSAA